MSERSAEAIVRDYFARMAAWLDRERITDVELTARACAGYGCLGHLCDGVQSRRTLL